MKSPPMTSKDFQRSMPQFVKISRFLKRSYLSLRVVEKDLQLRGAMVRIGLAEVRWGASCRATLGPPNAALEARKTPRLPV